MALPARGRFPALSLAGRNAPAPLAAASGSSGSRRRWALRDDARGVSPECIRPERLHSTRMAPLPWEADRELNLELFEFENFREAMQVAARQSASKVMIRFSE